MDKELKPELKTNFIECLKLWHIPEEHLQALECIFRQCMMSHKDTNYVYNHDWIERKLTGKLAPEERYNRIRQYIQEWEAKSGFKYGFEGLHMDEMDRVNKALETYSKFKNMLKTLASENDLIFDDRAVTDFIKSLQIKIEEKIRINGRSNKRFLSFTDKMEPALNNLNHEYFVRYIGLSHAVFYDYCESCRREKFKDEPDTKGNHIFRLTAARLSKDHADVLEGSKIRPEQVKERFDNNRKGQTKWQTVVSEVSIMDDAFINFLVSSNKNLKTLRSA